MKKEIKMAKITVDDDLCIGCGLCASMCPDLFEMTDDSKAKVKGDSCKGHDLKDVVSQCPVEAIKMESHG